MVTRSALVTGFLLFLALHAHAGPGGWTDSDVNDPSALPNVANDSAETSQAIPNISTVHGFATLMGTARKGDRFENGADPIDQYRVVLEKHQTVDLRVDDFAGTRGLQGDLDLLLMDAEGKLVGVSDSTTEFEKLVVPEDGEYIIVVQAISGSSNYELDLSHAVDEPLSGIQSMDFLPGERISGHELACAPERRRDAIWACFV